jgi:hypothetical protein
MKNAIPEIDAGISNESIPCGGDACILLRCVRSFEVFVDNGIDRVEGRDDIPCDDLIIGWSGASAFLFICKYNIDLYGKRGGSQ